MAEGLVINSDSGNLLASTELVGMSLQRVVTLDNTNVTVLPPVSIGFPNGDPLIASFDHRDLRQDAWVFDPVDGWIQHATNTDTTALATGVFPSSTDFIKIEFGEADDDDDVEKIINVGIIAITVTSPVGFGQSANIQMYLKGYSTITRTFTGFNQFKTYWMPEGATTFTVSHQFAQIEHPFECAFLRISIYTYNDSSVTGTFIVNNQISARLINGTAPVSASFSGSVSKEVLIPGVVDDPPLIFVAPTQTHLYYGIMYKHYNGTEWVVGIIQSGEVMQPSKLYIYSKKKVVWEPSTHGLLLNDDIGTVTFDSRSLPLQIVNTATGVSPTYPPVSGNPGTTERLYDFGEGRDPFPGNDHNFVVGSPNAVNVTLPSVPLMFTIPSLATASYTRYHHYKWYDTEGWLFTWRQKHDYYRAWSVFYLQGFQINAGQTLFNWIPYKSSFKERRKYAASGNPFDDDSIDGITGVLPYYDATINNQPNTVLIAKVPNV